MSADQSPVLQSTAQDSSITECVHTDSGSALMGKQPRMNSGSVPMGKQPRMEYSEINVYYVRRLTIMQLSLAVILVVLHIYSTAVNVHFYYGVQEMRKELNDQHFVKLNRYMDLVGSGIWIGAFIIITALVGIGGYRKQTKALIIANLVMNIVGTLLCAALMTVLAFTAVKLWKCVMTGEAFLRDSSTVDWPSEDSIYWDQTALKVSVFYGERLVGHSGYFYCHHIIFQTWFGVDGLIFVLSGFEIVVASILIMYSLTALCSCLSSFTPFGEKQEDGAVAYHSQTDSLRHISEPTPEVQEVPGTQAMSAQGTSIELSQQSTKQPLLAASAEEKMEEKPSVYTTMLPNQPK